MKTVNPRLYTKKYFLDECEGGDYWERSWGQELNPRLAYAWDLAKIQKGEKVLDVGCGRGEMLVRSALAGAKAVGIDYSQEAVSLSRAAIYKNKLRAKAQAIWVSGKRLPFADDSFGVVFFLDVAEHLYPEELGEMLVEIRRVLKPDGRLVVHTAPNRDWLEGGYKYFTRYANFLASKLIWEPVFRTKLMYSKDPRNNIDKKVHVNEQSVESLRQSLKNSGFGKVDVWLDSSFRRINKGFWFQFTLLQPIWVPVFGKYFQMDIWGMAGE